HQHNGLLFNPGNPKLLSAAVSFFNDLINNQQFSLYNGARATYLERYHPEQCYQAVMNIYNNILSIGK
ncbi:MAG: hypothetical protein H0X41_03535, partial [Chitinophagaceae bacterium]|nr:hypothetical protein [Chitinophagaceae bacterium]